MLKTDIENKYQESYKYKYLVCLVEERFYPLPNKNTTIIKPKFERRKFNNLKHKNGSIE
jgi:hypothetical protein